MQRSIFSTRVLLATDGSRDAELALTTVVDLAHSTNSELHVVAVAPGYPSYDVRGPATSVVERLRKQAENILEPQIEEVERAGGKVAQKHLRIAERYRAGQIVDVAEELGAGLIVMGSVSDSVVRHAHCPVLVVRPEKGEPPRDHPAVEREVRGCRGP